MTDIKKICIVGASGKLGTYMVQQALDRGYEVVGVCREQSVGKLDAFADLGAGGVKLDGGRGARATARNRIAAQMPQERKAALADFVIDNTDAPDQALAQVRSLYRQLTEKRPDSPVRR